jgi:hypothetical protein
MHERDRIDHHGLGAAPATSGEGGGRQLMARAVSKRMPCRECFRELRAACRLLVVAA